MLGLGAMGTALTRTWLAAGHRLTVWNRTRPAPPSSPPRAHGRLQRRRGGRGEHPGRRLPAGRHLARRGDDWPRSGRSGPCQPDHQQPCPGPRPRRWAHERGPATSTAGSWLSRRWSAYRRLAVTPSTAALGSCSSDTGRRWASRSAPATSARTRVSRPCTTWPCSARCTGCSPGPRTPSP
ncbi:NAD(P)-binding domain-containing protein [Micromonospora sp. M12]